MKTNPIEKLVETVKTGTREEVKEAQQAIERYWHTSRPKRKLTKQNFEVFVEEVRRFESIDTLDHQVAFLNILKWPFMFLGHEHFEVWSEFILKQVLHPSGKIRQAVIRAAEWLIFDLMFNYDFSPKASEKMHEKRNYFGSFAERIDLLLEQYALPEFDRYEYVSDIPTSVYKSLQKLMSEVVMRAPQFAEVYHHYLAEKEVVIAQQDPNTAIPTLEEGDFWEQVNEVIAEKRHVEYLEESKKEYAQYRQFFADFFTDKQPANTIYRFRVTYLRTDKKIWRDIEILGHQNFFRFAQTITQAMGWEDDHMHGFSPASPEAVKKDWSKLSDDDYAMTSFTYFHPAWEDDPSPTYKTSQVRVAAVDYSLYPRLQFEFDYGDGHIFFVDYQGQRPMKKDEKTSDFPRVIGQFGKAPLQYPPLDGDGDEAEESDESETFHFDGCIVCRGMKLAEIEGRTLGKEELKTLFDEANQHRH